MDANPGASEGEALFNLDLACGAYCCARCHTQGWSYGDPGVTGAGCVRLEPHRRCHQLALPRARQDMITFIKAGSENGSKYGMQGQGSGPHARLRPPAHR